MREELARQISDLVAIATAGWKDQKTLDVETTEAIIARIQTWAKLFGFFVAMPLVLIAVWLGLLGYRSYTDFQSSIAKAQAEIDSKLKASEQNVAAIQKRAGELVTIEEKLSTEQEEVNPKLAKAEESVEALQARSGELSKRLDAAAQLAPKFESLSNRVDNLQAAIVKFQSSSELTADRRRHIQEVLTSFRSYLVGLGFSAPREVPTVSVAISPNESALTSMNQMLIGSNLLDDPGSFLWAYADPILKQQNPTVDGFLEFVLNHYYPASFLGKKEHSLDYLAGQDKYDWISVFWMVRQSIGKDSADSLFMVALEGSGPRGGKGVDQYLSDLLIRTAGNFKGGAYSGAIKTLLAGDLPKAVVEAPPNPGK
jgi:hypothetical protein